MQKTTSELPDTLELPMLKASLVIHYNVCDYEQAKQTQIHQCIIYAQGKEKEGVVKPPDKEGSVLISEVDTLGKKGDAVSLTLLAIVTSHAHYTEFFSWIAQSLGVNCLSIVYKFYPLKLYGMPMGLTVEYRIDCPSDTCDGTLQRLAIQEKVELYMVIAHSLVTYKNDISTTTTHQQQY